MYRFSRPLEEAIIRFLPPISSCWSRSHSIPSLTFHSSVIIFFFAGPGASFVSTPFLLRNAIVPPCYIVRCSRRRFTFPAIHFHHPVRRGCDSDLASPRPPHSKPTPIYLISQYSGGHVLASLCLTRFWYFSFLTSPLGLHYKTAARRPSRLSNAPGAPLPDILLIVDGTQDRAPLHDLCVQETISYSTNSPGSFFSPWRGQSDP